MFNSDLDVPAVHLYLSILSVRLLAQAIYFTRQHNPFRLCRYLPENRRDDGNCNSESRLHRLSHTPLTMSGSSPTGSSSNRQVGLRSNRVSIDSSRLCTDLPKLRISCTGEKRIPYFAATRLPSQISPGKQQTGIVCGLDGLTVKHGLRGWPHVQRRSGELVS